MDDAPVIVWFRLDLRIEDHPALKAAVKTGRPIVPLYIWAPEGEAPWGPGGASRWWLHQSLAALAAALQRRGSRLVIRKGENLATLQDVIQASGATDVYWSRRYEPHGIERDHAIERALARQGIGAKPFAGVLLVEPGTVLNKQGAPYQVFTPFYKRCLASMEIAQPQPAPRKFLPPPVNVSSLPLDELGLEPRVDWAGGLRAAWTPGEKGAQAELNRFIDDAMAAYPDDRDRPDRIGTSRLSPHLHFGEISPRSVWHAVTQHADLHRGEGLVGGAEAYLRQVMWREFAHHLLFHFPHTEREPLREEFRHFPWQRNEEALAAWQQGRTGYPIVDAGMRQLWETGWMHNRVRMIVASFLVKDLLIPWQEGAAWFWETLVDADLANNTLGWQWTAGCGADAAPFFRIFNPVTQGERFDPDGAYVRRFVPELATVDTRWIHKPWEAPKEILRPAGADPGGTYPSPMVRHADARDAALEAYTAVKEFPA